MKMITNDYKKLKKAVFEVIDRDPDILTRDVDFVNDMEEARRWIIYWIAVKDCTFRVDYLKDSHIDTALRRIIKEYKKEVV